MATTFKSQASSGHSAHDPICLTDSDDDLPPARPTKSLPRRARIPITIVSSSDEEIEVVERDGAARPKTVTTTPSRKGKAAEGPGQRVSEGKTANAEPSSSKIAPSSSRIADDTADSTHQRNGNVNPPAPTLCFPIRSTVGGLIRLLELHSKSKWKYVPCAPPSGSVSDRVFKCSYPECRFQIGFRDHNGNGKVWSKTPKLLDIHNHNLLLLPREVPPTPAIPAGSRDTRIPATAAPGRSAHDVLMSSRHRDGGEKSKTRGPTDSPSTNKTRVGADSIAPASTLSGLSRHGTSVPVFNKSRQPVGSSSTSRISTSPVKASRIERHTAGQLSRELPKVPAIDSNASPFRKPIDKSSTTRDHRASVSRETTARLDKPSARLSTPDSAAQAGIKRSHSGAFGSHAKPERTPGGMTIGRDLRNRIRSSQDSPGEVSAMIQLEALGQSPWRPKSSRMDRKLNRSDTSIASTLRGTPTPSEAPSHARRRMDSIASASAQQTLITPVRTGITSGEPSPLKRSFHDDIASSDSIAPPVVPTQTGTSSTLTPAPGTLTSASQPTKSASTSRASIPRTELDPSQSATESSGTSRPKRSRPAAGTYTVPSMNATHWPSVPASGTRVAKVRANSRKQPESAADNPQRQPPTPRTQPSLRPAQTPSAEMHTSAEEVQRNLSAALPLARTEPSTTPVARSQTSLASGAVSRGSPSKQVQATPQSSSHRRAHSGATVATSSQRAKGARSPRSDSSEEVNEAVENLLPSLPESQQSQDHSDDDLLAEFGDFQFDLLSPLQSTKSLQDDAPRTPSGRSQADQTTPRPKPTPSRVTESGSNHKLLNTPTGSQVNRMHKTPSGNSTLFALSPARPRAPVAAARPSLADRILDNAIKDAEEERKLLLEKEASVKRMAELFGDDDEVADDATLEQISRRLNFDFVKAKEALEEVNQGAQSVGSGRSRRLRGSSLKGRSRKSVPPTTLRPGVPSTNRGESDRFFAEQRKRAKQGLGVGVAEDLLESIRASSSPTKTDHPYPTPESDRFSNSEASSDEGYGQNGNNDDDLPEVDLEVFGHSDLGGVLSVARELQESRRSSRRQTPGSLALEWEGFWTKRTTSTGSSTPAVVPVQPAVDDVRAPTSESDFMYHGSSSRILASLAAAGVCALRLWKSEISISDQIFATVAESSAAKRHLMVDHTIHRLENPSAVSGDSDKMVDVCASIWQAYGSRPDLFQGIKVAMTGPLVVSREEAIHFTCRVLEASIRTGRVAAQDCEKLLSPLLLLAVDRATADETISSIRSMLHLMWPICLGITTATQLASGLCKQFEHLPTFVKVQILLTVGQVTESARSVSSLVAIEWLAPGCLDRSVITYREEPTLQTLILGSERLLAVAHEPNSSVEAINDMTTFLYQALSDIDTLVQKETEFTGVSDDDHPIRDLKALVIKISHKLRMNGTDTQRLAISQTKGRLSQLAIVLEMQFETTFKRLKKARMSNNIGKGLKAGKDGQAMLSFSRDSTV